MKRQCERNSRDLTDTDQEETSEGGAVKRQCNKKEEADGVQKEGVCVRQMQEKIDEIAKRVRDVEEKMKESEEEEMKRRLGVCEECGKEKSLKRLLNTKGTGSMLLCGDCHNYLDPERQRACSCDWDEDMRNCLCFYSINDYF